MMPAKRSLEQDSQLDSSYQPLAKTGRESSPRNILLTGATGFVGVHLLTELIQQSDATIYCLIRQLEKKREPFAEHLNTYQFSTLHNHPRIVLIDGDFSLPNFGLSDNDYTLLAETVDSIYHCGAFVHHAHSYEKLYSSNVASIFEVLKLASTSHNKHIHYINTLGVLSSSDTENPGQFVGENTSHLVPIGYPRSKWVAERLLGQASERGFSVSSYRFGFVHGQSTTGITPNANWDHFLRFVKACGQMGFGPNDWGTAAQNTVDNLSKLIVAISLHDDATGQAFNFYDPNTPSWMDVLGYLSDYGIPVKLVDNETWLNQHLANVDESNALFPLRPFYLPVAVIDDLPALIDTSNTATMMEELGLSYTPMDNGLFFKYFDHLGSWLTET